MAPTYNSWEWQTTWSHNDTCAMQFYVTFICQFARRKKKVVFMLFCHFLALFTTILACPTLHDCFFMLECFQMMSSLQQYAYTNPRADVVRSKHSHPPQWQSKEKEEEKKNTNWMTKPWMKPPNRIYAHFSSFPNIQCIIISAQHNFIFIIVDQLTIKKCLLFWSFANFRPTKHW